MLTTYSPITAVFVFHFQYAYSLQVAQTKSVQANAFQNRGRKESKS